MKKFYFIGDFICNGQHISLHKTWVYKFSKWLDKNYYGKFNVQNISVNGITSESVLQRLYYQVLRYKPDICYIQLGMSQ